MIDFSDLKPKPRKPTKKEAALYRRWLVYLRDSKLSKNEIHKRAEIFTVAGREVPDEP